MLGATIFLLLVVLERFEKYEARNSMAEVPLKPIKVEAVRAGSGNVTRWVVGEGTAEAVRKSMLEFEVSGKVAFIATEADGNPIREGSRVRGPGPNGEPGRLLARLDTRDPASDIRHSSALLAEARREVEAERAALTRARNALTDARADFDRDKKLFEQKIVSARDFEHARTRFRNSEADVRSAEARLAAIRSRVEGAVAQLNKSQRGHEKASLTAPFDGVVARINIKPGDKLDPEDVDHSTNARSLETAPMTIIDPSEMEVTLNMPLHDGLHVQPGQTAVVLPGGTDWFRNGDAGDFPEVEGRVRSVSPQLDAAGRSVRVKVRIAQDENLIRDNMYTTCWIAVEEKKPDVRIPLETLLFRDNTPYVYVIRNNTAERRDVVLGIADDTCAEVLKGVLPNEWVVTEGRHILAEGLPVQLLPDEGEIEEGENAP